MILGFKQKFPWGKPTNFKEKILSGQKKHSIREDKKRRWKSGMLIHMAYGVRTKFYECFCNKHRCKSTQTIKIKHVTENNSKNSYIEINGRLVFRYPDTYSLGLGYLIAKNDGFESIVDFFKWFDKDFEGVIIHWTDLRY